MLVVVSDVLHNKVPVNPEAVRSELPSQLLTTPTIGVPGFVFGADIPDPVVLVQPFTVCVTV